MYVRMQLSFTILDCECKSVIVLHYTRIHQRTHFVPVLRLSVLDLYELIGLHRSLTLLGLNGLKGLLDFKITTLINTMILVGLSGTCRNHVGAGQCRARVPLVQSACNAMQCSCEKIYLLNATKKKDRHCSYHK